MSEINKKFDRAKSQLTYLETTAVPHLDYVITKFVKYIVMKKNTECSIKKTHKALYHSSVTATQNKNTVCHWILLKNVLTIRLQIYSIARNNRAIAKV